MRILSSSSICKFQNKLRNRIIICNTNILSQRVCFPGQYSSDYNKVQKASFFSWFRKREEENRVQASDAYNEAIVSLGGAAPTKREFDNMPETKVVNWDQYKDMAIREVEDLSKDSSVSGEDLQRLGDIFYQGHEELRVEKDLKKAVSLYKAASDQGNYDAMYSYGRCLQTGQGMYKSEPKLKEAIRVFKKLVENEHGFGTYTLGLLYLENQAISDKTKAYKLMIKAKSLGVPMAYKNLANMYAHGIGTQRNDTLAFELYEYAADRGDKESMFTLASWYCQGRLVQTDWDKGFKYHARAAEGEMGLPKAQYNMGTHYFSGQGVEQNFEKAIHFFKLAAQNGHGLQAHVNLGMMYIEGKGVEKDIEEGKKYMQYAADRGNELAQAVLKELKAAEEKSSQSTNEKTLDK